LGYYRAAGFPFAAVKDRQRIERRNFQELIDVKVLAARSE
jgi:hypothetical protein